MSTLFHFIGFVVTQKSHTYLFVCFESPGAFPTYFKRLCSLPISFSLFAAVVTFRLTVGYFGVSVKTEAVVAEPYHGPRGSTSNFYGSVNNIRLFFYLYGGRS